MTTIPSSGLVLLDFTAQWCPPCRQLEPVLESIGHAYQLPVVAIDVEVERDLAQRFGVKSMPTVVLWRDGREVGRMVGARPRAFVAGMVARALAGDVAITSP